MFKQTDLRYSLGFGLVDEGEVVTYLIPGSPADQAGVTPGAKLIAVNGRKYSKEVLQDALDADGTEPRIVSLLMEKDETYKTFELHYAGNARYPRLERDPLTPDLLTAIGAARTQ